MKGGVKMTEELKYKDVPLTDEEYEEATINVAQIKSQIESGEMNLKHLEIDEENRYSERLSVLNARRKIKEMKERIQQDIETNKKNLEVYERQVKTKMREEPVEEEESEEESEE